MRTARRDSGAGAGDGRHRLHRDREAVQSGAEPDRRRPRTTVTTREAAAHAALHVQTLTGRDPEGVTSLERTEGGWRIGIEVLEAHRIPDSTDILAEYQVEVDGDGELITYHRTRRYYRGRAEEG